MKFEGTTIQGREVSLAVSGGVIESVLPESGESPVDPERVLLGPALIDLQVNGFGGVDFNRPGLTTADLEKGCRGLAATGVGSFFPTLITASKTDLEASAKAIREATEESPLVRGMVAGIHLEGPFINPQDGPRGAHPREHVREPDWGWFQRLREMAGGLIRLVTLAPEIPGGLDFTARAAGEGMVVSLGHCAPPPEVVEAALAAGARMSTHLGNAAHELLPRHANYVQKQMAEDGLMAGMICDGHHLPPYFVKNMVRAKGLERIVLVTDATAASGSPPGTYSMGGLELEAGPDGVLRLPGTPFLAGSTLTQDRAVMNCARFAGIEPARALEAATANPGRLFPDCGGALEPGRPANLIRYRIREGRMEIAETYTAGQRVFRADR